MINYKVIITAGAREDFTRLLDWYRGMNEALPSRLKADLNQTVKRLGVHPFAHAVRFADIRLAMLKVFPVNVHYYIDEANTSVLLIGIYHEAANPDHWRSLTNE